MKEFLYLILVILLIPNVLEAQKTWQFERTNFAGSQNRIIKYCGDTIIEGKSWNILEMGRLFYNNSNEVSTGPIGLTKEENGEFEYIDSQSGSRLVLYNYNLAIGDTTSIQFAFPSEMHEFLVVNKDTIMLNGVSRRALTLKSIIDPLNFDVWVEDIGSVMNSLLNPGERNNPDNSSSLTCFQEGASISIWGDSIVGACKIDSIIVLCSIISGTEEQNSNWALAAKAYPNPFESLLNIDYVEGVDKLEIYRLSGRRVFQKYINPENGSITLNLEQLNPGIYAILFYGQNGKTEYRPVVKVR